MYKSKSNTKILVVEDEQIVAEDIKYTLESLGYTVPITVSSGEEAIKKADEIRPSIILMDIMLQGKIKGIEAAHTIKKSFNIPIIYLTAHTDENIFQLAKNTEPAGYITKPFQKEELRRVIEIALYRRRIIEIPLKKNEYEDPLEEGELYEKKDRIRELLQKMDMFLVKDKLERKIQEVSARQELGQILLDAITDLQDEFAKKDPKAPKNEKGEKFRSQYVDAETLKGKIMQLFHIEDGR